MTLNDDSDTLQIAALMRLADNFNHASPDRGSATGVFELPFPTKWLTQHMTATWGT